MVEGNGEEDGKYGHELKIHNATFHLPAAACRPGIPCKGMSPGPHTASIASPDRRRNPLASEALHYDFSTCDLVWTGSPTFCEEGTYERGAQLPNVRMSPGSPEQRIVRRGRMRVPSGEGRRRVGGRVTRTATCIPDSCVRDSGPTRPGSGERDSEERGGESAERKRANA